MKKVNDSIAILAQDIQNYKLDSSNAPAFKKRFLDKESDMQKFFHTLPTLAPEERKAFGQQLNTLKASAKKRYDAARFSQATTQDEAKEDMMLPPPTTRMGGLHILTQIEQRVIHILEKIGFRVVKGPEIEDEWHNFSALNFPPHHPARDMQDTFFVKGKNKQKMSLRTQTSCVQIRVMEQKKLPIRILSVGRVFRKETISTRSHCAFHQVEGLYVNKGVNFIDLKEVLHYFVHALFGEDVEMRMRPSYFPFTEPSAEVDIVCLLCKRNGCSVCKKSGWVEIGGAGMVDPNVLVNCGICPETYQGFAFGIGIERMAMLIAQIPDVRLFMENDLRFLKQFTGNNIN